MKVEVLCTTMYQRDMSKYNEMNIQTDVVYANQGDRYDFEETQIGGKNVRMISTAQRGVGKNRNVALLHAVGDICIFSDDDVCYVDGYEEIVQGAFQEVPQADILIFNFTTGSSRKEEINRKIKRGRIWNVLSYGTYRIAFRLGKIQKANIWFTTLFGGGSKYLCGEDSLWLVEALKKGLKIYTYPRIIGEVKQEESTWFSGYNEDYFFSRGAWLQAALPKMKYLMTLYYIIRFRKISKISSGLIYKFIRMGMDSYKIN